MNKNLSPFALFSFLIFCFTSLAQGWYTILPDIPNTPSLIDRISFHGLRLNEDSIYSMVNYTSGAANSVEEYVVLHVIDGQRLDYFQVPTIENKDRNIDTRFLFTSGDNAIHTFYTFPEQNEIIEYINLNDRKVEWSKKNLRLIDCVSNLEDTYSDILCRADSGDYVFLDKQNGSVLKLFSADSLSAFIGSFGQRDSVFEITRIAGNDSIQYFQGFISKNNGDINIIHVKYEKYCDCITAETEFNRWIDWDIQKGFNMPQYTIYNVNHQQGDSTISASIRMFNFDGDTIISENIQGPATRGIDSAWTKPRIRLIRGFDKSYLIESPIIRNGILNGRPELQGGFRFLFYNSNGNLINETEAFFLKGFNTKSQLTQALAQSSYVLRPDSSATIAFRSTRDLFATIGFVNFNKDGISPLNINKSTISQKTIQVYPNPFNNRITISNESNEKILAVNVFNCKGEIKKVVNLPQSSSLNMGDLPIGFYQIEIITTVGVSRFKIIKN
jgi:hypothetical protein